LLKGVSVKDNSNEEITAEVKGEYDYKKAGTYNLKYTATDSSKNTTEKDFILTVKKKDVVKPVQPITKPITADTTFTTSKGFQGKTVNGITYIDGILIVNKTYSLPSTYGTGLTTTTQNAFNEMKAAATLEGLNIYLSSGFRSYNTQSKLYNNYVKRDGQAAADTYSARAGHSEHQSGLAFDVNQINDTFNNTAEAKWLSDNCYKYGFILRYPKGKTNETGYKYESWHFRYVGTELATKLYIVSRFSSSFLFSSFF
jgi:D-alanyl-D-alanine carboxypeptidase